MSRSARRRAGRPQQRPAGPLRMMWLQASCPSGAWLGGLAALLIASQASAQLSPQIGVPVPGRPFAGITDASAVALNPANLALLPSWEGRAMVVSSGGDRPLPTRGVSVDLASPLFF